MPMHLTQVKIKIIKDALHTLSDCEIWFRFASSTALKEKSVITFIDAS
jgi:hypothetical protein